MTSSAFETMLGEAINCTFERECGKGQNSKGRKAFQVTLALDVDYHKEEGHRSLELVFWAPMNYVQTWVRETSLVIPVEELDFDDEGEPQVKKSSPGYRKTEEAWRKIADHSTGWKDATRQVLKEFSPRIHGFVSCNGSFWKLIPVRELSISV